MKKRLLIAVAAVIVLAGIYMMTLGAPKEVASAEGDSSWRSSMAAMLAAARRRAVRSPSPAYYVDADRDGYGDAGRRLDEKQNGAATNGLDCNDASADVYQLQKQLLPDCNVNRIADDDLLTQVCVGAVQKKMVQSETVENGQIVLRGQIISVYADAKGKYWISSSEATKNADGRLRTDITRGSCPRL